MYYIPYIFKPLCLVKLFLYFSGKQCPVRLPFSALGTALRQHIRKPPGKM